MTKTNILKLISISSLMSLGSVSLNAAIAPIRIDLGDDTQSTQYGDTKAATDHLNYTDTGFLGFNNGTTSSGFTVEAPDEFTSIKLRFASSSTNPGEYYVYIDNSASLTFSGPTIVFAQTGSWDTWSEVTLELSGDAGDFFNLGFANNASNNGGVNVDYIEFNVVPEPASYALMLSAVALTGACLRRRPR